MTKARLLEYRDLVLERRQLAEELAGLEAVVFSPRASEGGRGGGASFERMAIRHMELIAQYQAKQAETEAAMAEIEQAIESLPPRERTLMRYRYIDALGWDAICGKMSYSWRQVHRIHRQALERLEQI